MSEKSDREILEEINRRLETGGELENVEDDIWGLLEPIRKEKEEAGEKMVRLGRVLFLIEDTEADMQDEIYSFGATQFPDELPLVLNPNEPPVGKMVNIKREKDGKIYGDLIFRAKYEDRIRAGRPCIEGKKISTRDIVMVEEVEALGIGIATRNADHRIPKLKEKILQTNWPNMDVEISGFEGPNEHFIRKCMWCLIAMSQCQCSGHAEHGRTVLWGACGECNQKPVATLTNARLLRDKYEDGYKRPAKQTGVTGVIHIGGQVSGHKKLIDGESIRTSVVIGLNMDKMRAVTRNTRYILTNLGEEFKLWISNNNYAKEEYSFARKDDV